MRNQSVEKRQHQYGCQSSETEAQTTCTTHSSAAANQRTHAHARTHPVRNQRMPLDPVLRHSWIPHRQHRMLAICEMYATTATILAMAFITIAHNRCYMSPTTISSSRITECVSIFSLLGPVSERRTCCNLGKRKADRKEGGVVSRGSSSCHEGPKTALVPADLLRVRTPEPHTPDLRNKPGNTMAFKVVARRRTTTVRKTTIIRIRRR